MRPVLSSPRMRRLRQSRNKLTAMLLLAMVLLSLTATTANAASKTSSSSVVNATANPQPLLAAATRPIEYHIGCPPSMVNDGSLDYFKAHGFTAVHLVVLDTGTHQAELNKIKSLGMKPIIDVEVPIWNGGQLQSTPISNFGGYFLSLKNAGWEYVASEGGRAGDLDYMKQFFKGYVNYNCDRCGLWKDMYKHSFTVANSWESYYTSEWPYIQQGATVAASLGIQNGLLAGLWEYGSDGVDYNPILTNSKSGGSPSYKSMLDWSYSNGIGFTHFHVWCGSNSQGLSRYKALGFEQVVANLQVYYPPTTSVNLVVVASSTKPVVGQQVTITANLKSGTAPLASKRVTIFHYFKGLRYEDGTWTTNANGQVALTTSWGSIGKREYYAKFVDDTLHESFYGEVTINVSAWTRVPLTTSTTTPLVNQQVRLTSTLSWWNSATRQWVTATSGKPIKVYHVAKGIRYDDGTWTTNANGQITFVTSWRSIGQRSYYATFTGDTWYKASTGAIAINVH